MNMSKVYKIAVAVSVLTSFIAIIVWSTQGEGGVGGGVAPATFKLDKDRVVIYVDWKVNWNDFPSDLTLLADNGFTHIILAFWMKAGAADAAIAWTQLDQGQRSKTLTYLHDRGVKLMVSAAGATENVEKFILENNPTGKNYGRDVANWALKWGLDGVDFDLELTPGDPSLFKNGRGTSWFVAATLAAKAVFSGAGEFYEISHAPQAPYFGDWAGPTGGYVKVYEEASGAIDFFNVQFYNQGQCCEYNTYGTLIESTDGTCMPRNSLLQIADMGIPKDKLVVGKYICGGCGNNGFVEANTLGGILSQAVQNTGWRGGAMAWMYVPHDPTITQWGNVMAKVFQKD